MGFFFVIHAYLVAKFLWRNAGYTRFWIPVRPPAFIAGAFVTLIFCAIFLVLMRPVGLLYALACALNSVFGLFNPVASLSFLVTVLFMRPWELIADPHPFFAVMVRYSAVLCLVSWVIDSFRKRRFAFVMTSELVVYLLLLVWLLVTALLSLRPSEGFEFLFSNYFPTTVLILLILNVVERNNDLQLLRDSTVLAISGVIAVGVVYALMDPAFTSAQYRLQGAGFGLLADSNDMGSLVVIALCFLVITKLFKKSKFSAKFFALVTVGLLLLALLFTQSRGSMLAVAVAGATFLVVGRKLSKKALLFSTPLIVFPILIATTISRDEADLNESSSARMNCILTALRMFQLNPIVGVGIGNYTYLYQQYSLAYFGEGEKTAHSSWALVLAEAGFPGFILFTAFYGLAGIAAWRVRRTAPEFLVVFVGYTACMTILSHTHIFLPYFLCSMCFAVRRVMAKDAAKETARAIPKK